MEIYAEGIHMTWKVKWLPQVMKLEATLIVGFWAAFVGNGTPPKYVPTMPKLQ